MAVFIDDMRVGSEYTLEIAMTEDDGTPINITGYKFWLTLKSNPEDLDTAAGLQYSTNAGDEPSDNALGGKCYLVVPSSIMKTVIPGEYVYDVRAKKPGPAGEGITTLTPPIEYADDIVIVKQEITRAIS